MAVTGAEFSCVPKSGVLKVVALKIRGVAPKTGASKTGSLRRSPEEVLGCSVAINRSCAAIVDGFVVAG